jgi:hypothetical protein
MSSDLVKVKLDHEFLPLFIYFFFLSLKNVNTSELYSVIFHEFHA